MTGATHTADEKGPNLGLPRYDNKEPWHEYIKRLTTYANYALMTKERLAKALPVLLDGEAKALYDSLDSDDRKEWEKVSEGMGKLLRIPGSDTIARRLLQSRTQRSDEGEAEFAAAIRSLVERAMPTTKSYTDDQRLDMAIDSFRNGLNPTIKLAVLRKPRPTTMGAAISQAREEKLLISEYEEASRRDDFLIAQVKLKQTTEALSKEIADLKDKLSLKEDRNPRVAFAGREMTQGRVSQTVCEYCSKPNHTFSECRLRQVECYKCGARGHYANRCHNSRQNPNSQEIQQPTSSTFSGGQNFGRNANTAQRGRRTKYKINALPTLTIIALLFHCIQAQYQICLEGLPGVAIPAPHFENCTTPEKEVYENRSITLYLPRRKLLKFQLFECAKVEYEKCLQGPLPSLRGQPPLIKIRKPTTFQVCENMISRMISPEGQLHRKDEFFWRTENPLKAPFVVFSYDCARTINYELREGQGGIQNNKLVTSLTGISNCTYAGEEFCQHANGTFVYKMPNLSYAYTHDSHVTPEALFYTAPPRIVIPKIEAVFVPSNRSITTERGVPAEAIPLDKDAFYVVNKLKPKEKRDTKQLSQRHTFKTPNNSTKVQPFDNLTVADHQNDVSKEERFQICVPKGKSCVQHREFRKRTFAQLTIQRPASTKLVSRLNKNILLRTGEDHEGATRSMSEASQQKVASSIAQTVNRTQDNAKPLTASQVQITASSPGELRHLDQLKRNHIEVASKDIACTPPQSQPELLYAIRNDESSEHETTPEKENTLVTKSTEETESSHSTENLTAPEIHVQNFELNKNLQSFRGNETELQGLQNPTHEQDDFTEHPNESQGVSEHRESRTPSMGEESEKDDSPPIPEFDYRPYLHELMQAKYSPRYNPALRNEENLNAQGEECLINQTSQSEENQPLTHIQPAQEEHPTSSTRSSRRSFEPRVLPQRHARKTTLFVTSNRYNPFQSQIAPEEKHEHPLQNSQRLQCIKYIFSKQSRVIITEES